MPGELAGYAVIEHRQRRGTQSFRHQQVLVKADILRGPVSPVVAETNPFLTRADGILPEHLAEVVGAFRRTAAGEAHESGMQVFQGLQQVFAERTVLAVFPQFGGFRNQRYKVQPEGTLGIGQDGQPAVHGTFSLEGSGVLLPLLPQLGNGDNIGIGIALGVLKTDRDITFIFGPLQVQRQVIAYSFLGGNGGHLRVVGINEAVAFLIFGNAVAVGRNAEAGAGLFNVEAHGILLVAQLVVVFVVGVVVVPAFEVFDQRLVFHSVGHAPGTFPAQDGPAEENGIALREFVLRAIRYIIGLEGIVLDELGADTAIYALVQILEENTGKGGADFNAQPIRLQGEGAFFHIPEAFQFQHLFCHAVTHQAHAFGVEVELVARAFAAHGRYYIGIGHHLRQVRQHYLVEGGAHAVLLGIFQFTGQ